MTSRRLIGPRIVVTLVALATLALAGAPASYGATTEIRGAFACGADGRPLAGARVELWQMHERWLPKVWPNIALRSTVRANADGGWGFRVSGGESNWFVRVVLVGEHTAVRDFPWPWNWFADTLRSQNDRPLRDYGTQTVPGYQCAVWNGFNDAGVEYRQQVGAPPPQGVTVVQAGAPTAGQPFALYDEVWWPSGHPVQAENGTSKAKHEFAHVFRHRLDGDGGHFFGDATYFWYLRHHSGSSCERTNSGFAFNEGWAEYWAGHVMKPCDDPTGTIERNVAAGLQRLETTCAHSRARMVQVLAANRGRIHSLEEFEKALKCTRIRALGKRTPKKPATDLAVHRRALQAEGRAFVLTLSESERRLRREIAAAQRLARQSVPCPAPPCVVQVERELQPILLAGQATQARALRDRFAVLASPSGVLRLTGKPATLRALIAGTRAEAARIAARTLGEALRAARRGGANANALRVLSAAQSAAVRGNPAVLQGLAPIAPVSLGPPLPDAPASPQPLPDLLVDSIGLRSGALAITVKNTGAARADASKLAYRLRGGGESLLDVPALAPAETTTVTVPCGNAGPVTVGARADATNLIAEATESDNARTATIDCPGKPDLVVDRVFLTSATSWLWNVQIRNAGDGAAPPTKTALSQPLQAQVLIDTPALAPGASVTVTIACPYGSLAEATAQADASNLAEEREEANNARASDLGIGVGGRCRWP